MKYKSKSLTEGLQIKRLVEIEKVESLLIDVATLLGPQMHDDRLRELVESAYRRAKYIHGALAVETTYLN